MPNPILRPFAALSMAFILLAPMTTEAAKKKGKNQAVGDEESAREVFDPSLFQTMKWRNIGPYRGGRSTTAAGVAENPFSYYMGTTGGGLWRTEDAGQTWKNISDGHFETGSVGAVAVAPSDANVIWVGMGEACIRGVMTTHGDGVYRSTDRGRTFEHLGLEETRHISKIVVHPNDPDTAWVAAQGHQWGPSKQRGIYKTSDGGTTWKLVLFVDETTGASDLAIDASNPRILYAALWHHRRYPWKIESGGPGSGIWKSTDGGSHWEKLEEGLPEMMGKIGIAVSPARSDRIWAIVEAEEGGLYRSDDGGKKWERINEDREIQTRSWYYMHVFADPLNADVVWVLNAPAMKSIDGGKSFQKVRTPHGDNHDLWINPIDPRFMINANDGGANVSTNGGRTWSTQSNQPTAQFYRVTTDRSFPYRVYGGQQDNSALRIQSRTMGFGITERHWESISGCESAYPAFDPDDPRYVYAGCYQGILGEWDAVTKRERGIMAMPYLGLSLAPIDGPYRFNWNAPLIASPHDPKVLYHGGNVVLRTSDRGRSWQEISPDLTRDDEEKQGPGGGPITSEGAGGEVYGTLLSLVESPHEPGFLWAGSDDGLVHFTSNGGADWQNVTPTELGEAMINSIEISPHDPATVFVAVTRYKWNVLDPIIFKTTDNGATWSHLDSDLPENLIVRVVREDPVRRGLLYAGTEEGFFVSWDNGRQWQKLQLGLPVVPITDLQVHDDDLVVATQGRAFWILDDILPLRLIDESIAASDFHLFAPRDAFLDSGMSVPSSGTFGMNPPSGVVVQYIVGKEVEEDADEASDETESETSTESASSEETEADDEKPPWTIEILDAEGRLVRLAKSDDEPEKGGGLFSSASPPPSNKAGMNRWIWDLAYQAPAKVEGLALYGPTSPSVGPGIYRVRLQHGDLMQEAKFEVRLDPRSELTEEDYAPRQELLLSIRELLHELYDSANRLTDTKDQVEALMARVEDRSGGEAIGEAGKALVEKIDELDGELLQRGHTNFQDIINHPVKLNGQLAFLLASVGSGPPVNASAPIRFAELDDRFSAIRERIQALLDEDLSAFNAMFEEHAVPAVILQETTPSMPELDEGQSGEEVRLRLLEKSRDLRRELHKSRLELSHSEQMITQEILDLFEAVFRLRGRLASTLIL